MSKRERDLWEGAKMVPAGLLRKSARNAVVALVPPTIPRLLIALLALLGLSGQATVPSGTNIVENRADAGLLLNVQGGMPLASSAPRSATTAHWVFEPVGDGAVARLKNEATGFYLHAEGGRLQTGAIEAAWLSANWNLEYTDNPPDVRIENAGKGGYLHANERARVRSPRATPPARATRRLS